MESIIIAVVTTGFAYWFQSRLEKLIMIRFEGKKVAVLGAEATGKTTLLTFMTTGKLVKSYSATGTAKPFSGGYRYFKGTSIALKDTIDVPGMASDRDSWRNVFKEADILLYLVNAYKLVNGDTNTRIRFEKDWEDYINKWISSFSQKKIIIVGTHCDLDNNYNPAEPTRYLNKYFKSVDVVQQIRKEMIDPASIVVGSLETKEAATTLVKSIIDLI